MCRQLGYATTGSECKHELELVSISHALSFCAGGVAYSNAYFGAGAGPIYLDDVACTSSASQLLECSSRPILTHNCLHSADAGVRCKGNLINLGYSIHAKFAIHQSSDCVAGIHTCNMHDF